MRILVYVLVIFLLALGVVASVYFISQDGNAFVSIDFPSGKSDPDSLEGSAGMRPLDQESGKQPGTQETREVTVANPSGGIARGEREIALEILKLISETRHTERRVQKVRLAELLDDIYLLNRVREVKGMLRPSPVKDGQLSHQDELLLEKLASISTNNPSLILEVEQKIDAYGLKGKSETLGQVFEVWLSEL